MSTVNSNIHSGQSSGARQKRVPGEEGLWVFIFGDMAVFALIFVVYLYYRGQQPELFATAQRTLDIDIGVINTLVLLTSSMFVVIGVHAARRNVARLARAMFVGAFVCGVIFGIDKAIEWGHKFADGLTPATNDFFMYYYVLTGLHMVHVLLGMAVLVFLFKQAAKPVDAPRRLTYIEGGACFWHMVDLLWIVLFPLFYLVRS